MNGRRRGSVTSPFVAPSSFACSSPSCSCRRRISSQRARRSRSLRRGTRSLAGRSLQASTRSRSRRRWARASSSCRRRTRTFCRTRRIGRGWRWTRFSTRPRKRQKERQDDPRRERLLLVACAYEQKNDQQVDDDEDADPGGGVNPHRRRVPRRLGDSCIGADTRRESSARRRASSPTRLVWARNGH